MRMICKVSAVSACVALGCLLAGFAPSPAPYVSEIRGALSDGRTVRLPLSNPVYDAAALARPDTGRRSLDWNTAVSREEGADQTSMALLRFDEISVNDLTPVRPHASFLSGKPHVSTGETAESRERLLVTKASALSGPVCEKPFSLSSLTGSQSLNLEAGFHALSMLARSARYEQIVRQYAAQYDLDASLVMAIIQVESGFNPLLISSRRAHGLMQVVPATAGSEVHRWLGRNGQPSTAELLKPEINICYGAGYLHLLRTRHLEGIQNPRSLEYCVIAAYNGGSGAVLRHFGPTREKAFEAINALSPEKVLERLTESFPARETRSFVHKVLDAREVFVAAHTRQAASGMETAALNTRLARVTANGKP